MSPKRISTLPPARRDRTKKSTRNLAGVALGSTLVKHQIYVEAEMPTASRIGSSLGRSTFASPFSVTRSKISFMDMVAANFEHAEEKIIKEFVSWLDTQSLVDAVKHIPPISLHPSFDI